MIPSGRLIDEQFRSRALVRTMRLRIYLPPNYDRFEMRYPVLYLLHPWGMDESYWTDVMGFHTVTERLMHAGTVPPFVMVMPQGDKSYFINAADPHGHYEPIVDGNPDFFAGALEGCGDYGDYFLEEVIPYVDERYSTRTDRAGRVIAGISMGGAGAAALAFTHPDRFGGVGIHSPALFAPHRFGPPWIFGLNDPDALAARDPIRLAARLRQATAPRIYLDCGVDDEVAANVRLLHDALDKARIPHTYMTGAGGHSWDYWHERLPQYLGFYTAGW